jgi:DNA-binding NtrC family response regulator
MKLLIVDDEDKIIKILSRILSEEGYDLETACTGEEGIKRAKNHTPDIVLMDLNLPGMDGIESMSRIQQMAPETLTIILTAYGTISSAVEAMRKGAYDYLTKPFDNDELLMTIRRAEENLRLRREITDLKDQLREKYQFTNIIGQSQKIRSVFDLMEQVSKTDATVLVQGESGTGKELIVRAIHHAGVRKEKPFLAVNCGAIPPNLVESEFFGHEKGAFTDAKELRIGAFERAHGGTLFLDEIGELSLDTQVKLLRVLEDNSISRVGGSKEIPVDTRIIAATNKNLEKEIQKGSFRQDLYFRLNVFFIALPSLRERREDIPLLVDHFLEKYLKKVKSPVKDISSQAVKHLQSYDWPGNVRELENAIHSALIVCKGKSILPHHLPLRIQGYPQIQDNHPETNTGMEEKVGRICEEVEREMILKALTENNHSRTKAAEVLQISRKTLFNKMQKLGIE